MPLQRRPIWSYQLHISFYLCPSISNENISLAPHLTHIQIFQTYFQGTKWTVRGSNIWLRNYCKHIAKSIRYFKSPISPWWGLRGSLSSPPKISSSAEAPFYLFGRFSEIMTNFVSSIIFEFCFVQNLGHSSAKCAIFVGVGVRMSKNCASAFALFMLKKTQGDAIRDVPLNRLYILFSTAGVYWF